MQAAGERTFALVGPGRAGTAISLALVEAGWRARAVAGRTPDAPAARTLADLLATETMGVADAGRDADLVVIATPDSEIDAAALDVAPSLRAGALVVHLSGARGIDALQAIDNARADVQVGMLHPLQTLPGPLRGAWAAVAGPDAVSALALELGMRPFAIDDEQRAAYHATACIASNHLVALLGQVERLSTAVGVPVEAFAPLVRATVDNVFALGAPTALTGPVARGDLATVAAHLEALPASERGAYRALAIEALRVSGRSDDELTAVLEGGAEMITCTTIAEVRQRCEETRATGGTVGFVPTMGYFHDGHLSLMRAARADHDLVVVSLFVNPTQFGPNEDLAAYPRDAAGDARAAESVGVDVLFTPSVDEMYPRPGVTSVSVSGLTDGLCGASRPHHFGGVATVVTKLLSIVGPCTAYFGKKDFQQVAVVRRLVEDLNLPAVIVPVPTSRELDGLAMSSRNAYLTSEERQAATVLFHALEGALKTVVSGERDSSRVREVAVDLIAAEPLAHLDYAEVVRADDLAPVAHIDDGVEHVIALAAVVGTPRLIDNSTFTVDGSAVRFDLPGFGRSDGGDP